MNMLESQIMAGRFIHDNDSGPCLDNVSGTDMAKETEVLIDKYKKTKPVRVLEMVVVSTTFDDSDWMSPKCIPL